MHNAKLITATLAIFAVAIVCMTLLGTPHTTAQAYEQQYDTDLWVRITDGNTELYTNASTLKVTCLLEKSYYVKVIDEKSDYYLVELMSNTELFPKITGYVLKNRVTVADSTPQYPYYPTETVKVKENSAPVRFSPLDNAEIMVVATNTQTMSYYGKINGSGKVWYYVYYNNIFGYVESTDVTAPDIQLHPTPLPDENEPSTPINPDDSGDPTDQLPENDTLAQVLLTVFVILLAVGLVLAMFLPGNIRRNTSESYYDKHM